MDRETDNHLSKTTYQIEFPQTPFFFVAAENIALASGFPHADIDFSGSARCVDTSLRMFDQKVETATGDWKVKVHNNDLCRSPVMKDALLELLSTQQSFKSYDFLDKIHAIQWRLWNHEVSKYGL